jgi:SAM-dependent methyltransferase
MTWLDRLLQYWRTRVALRELPPGARVLDIGTHDGTLFRLGGVGGVGIDPELAGDASATGVTLLRGAFPADMPAVPSPRPFDAATALAVVEHVPGEDLAGWAKALAELIAPGGVLVITVPAPAVDAILRVLMRLRLVAGIEAHQHHRFKPGDLEAIFAPPLWRRAKHRTFELGLNHLYVFRRTADEAAGRP